MRTYLSNNKFWISEIRVHGVLCICEANRRSEARRGALNLARERLSRGNAQ